MFIEQVDSTLLESIKHGPRNGNRFCSAMKKNLIRVDFNITGPIELFRRKHFLDVKVVKVMVWGAFGYKGTICFQPITGRLNVDRYCNLLSKARLQKEGKRICGFSNRIMHHVIKRIVQPSF